MLTGQELKDFNELFAGIWTDALKLKYRKLCGEIIENGLKNNEYAGTKIQEVYDRALTIRRKNAENQYWFVTVNPHPDTELKQLMKCVDKVLKKKWMTKYIYVYEQRQDEIDKPYHGIHMHMVVEKGDKKKAEVIREVYNTCKRIVGSKQAVDVKPLENAHDLAVRLNYMLGQKADEEKRKKQVIDKIFRQENNLQSFYKKGEWEEVTYEPQ